MNYKLLKKELEKDNFNELIKYIDKNFGDNDSYDEIITSLENLFNLLLEINYVPNTRFCELLIEQSEKIKKIIETIYLEKRKEIKQINKKEKAYEKNCSKADSFIACCCDVLFTCILWIAHQRSRNQISC